MSFQGMSFQGMSFQGMSFQGTSLEGLPQRGIDRVRSFASPLRLRRPRPRRRAGAGAQPARGAGGPTPLIYTRVTNPDDRRAPAGQPDDTGAGSYLYVPGLAGDAAPTSKGTLLEPAVLGRDRAEADPSHAGSIIAYIADVEKDTRPEPLDGCPSNDDVYLYTVYYRQPATGSGPRCVRSTPTARRARWRCRSIPATGARRLAREVRVRLHGLGRRRQVRAQLGLQALEARRWRRTTTPA